MSSLGMRSAVGICPRFCSSGRRAVEICGTLLQRAAVALGNQEEVVWPALTESRVELVLIDTGIFTVVPFDIPSILYMEIPLFYETERQGVLYVWGRFRCGA